MIKKFKAVLEVELEINDYDLEDFNEPQSIENMEDYDYFTRLCRSATTSFVSIEEIK
jgi:hypothetical protein